MSTTPQERAAAVGELPHVRAWVRRFRRLAKDMPPEVWVYVAAGTPIVMACDEVGRPIERDDGRDGMDQGAVITSLSGGHWDGGDW
jgi:hypothetical protein